MFLFSILFVFAISLGLLSNKPTFSVEAVLGVAAIVAAVTTLFMLVREVVRRRHPTDVDR